MSLDDVKLHARISVSNIVSRARITWLWYSELGNEIYLFAKKRSLSPKTVIFQHSNVRNLRASTVYTVYESALRISNGTLFHNFAADTEKVRPPSLSLRYL